MKVGSPLKGMLVPVVLVVLLVASTAVAQASGRVLYYNGVGITAARQVDSKLPGAPVGFKNFVRAKITSLRSHSHPAGCYVGIGVNRVRTDGYASGSVNDCGGYAAIWKRQSTGWHQVIGTQQAFTCSQLRKYSIPSVIIGPNPKCWNGTSMVAYRHA